MFVHIVFWRLHEPAPNGRTRDENAREMKQRFDAMQGLVPGLLRCDVGIDVLRTAESSDVVLYTEFESRAAYEAYVVHPAHTEIAGFIGTVRSERRAVDYERPSAG
jgi:hypothetical protein